MKRSPKPWKILTLEEALTLLEAGQYHISIEDLASILHKCRKAKDEHHGLQLCAYLRKNGLETHKTLGNHLVSMLVEIGHVSDAQQVFDTLVYQNEWSWYSIIKGCIECRKPQHAFNLYEKMCGPNGICPGGHTYVALLRACAKHKYLETGFKIHADVARRGLLQKDPFVASTLVDMYSKCGLIEKAREVFEKLRIRGIVSWNTIMAAYVKCGHGREVLKCFEVMQLHGVTPDPVTFASSLRACGSLCDIQKGYEIHAEIQKKGLTDTDAFLGSCLVDMYAKCNSLLEAQKTFDKLSLKNAVIWNTLITAYANCGSYEEVLMQFHQMQIERVLPDVVTYTFYLKSCGSLGSLRKIEEMHAEIIKDDALHRHPLISSTLIDMYAKLGCLIKAKKVFNSLPHPDEASWTYLISAYVQHGQAEHALDLLEQMQLAGVPLNMATATCSLKACGILGAIDKGQEIHVEIERNCLTYNLFIATALIDMYAKCGFLTKAKEVFDKLPQRDLVLWNALMMGYAEQGCSEEAFKCFEQMQMEGFSPSSITFISIMKACSNTVGAVGKSQYIHAEIEQMGLLERDLMVGSTLIDMYAKRGLLGKAHEVFDKLTTQNVVTWNALITGYIEHGHGDMALQCLSRMKSEGISPDAFTFSSSLKACCMMPANNIVQTFHEELIREPTVGNDLFVCNTLIYMYGYCGLLKKAQEVFDNLLVCDVVSWNALISGYSESGHGEEALRHFDQIQVKGLCATGVTYVCGLKACGSIGAYVKGQQIHAEIVKKGLMEREAIGNNMIDMYAKCGLMSTAELVFDELLIQDIESWNALVAGYAQLGQAETVIHLFNRIITDGISPNNVTFLILLNTCSRAGLLDMSQTYFDVMNRQYGIMPGLKHQTCIVDLLGRVGKLEMAIGMIRKIPSNPNLAVWHMVLDACKNWGNQEVGKQAFEHALGLDKNDASSYVLMSQIYSGG